METLPLSQLSTDGGGGGTKIRRQQKTLVHILYIPFQLKLADAQAFSAEGFV